MSPNAIKSHQHHNKHIKLTPKQAERLCRWDPQAAEAMYLLTSRGEDHLPFNDDTHKVQFDKVRDDVFLDPQLAMKQNTDAILTESPIGAIARAAEGEWARAAANLTGLPMIKNAIDALVYFLIGKAK